MELSGMELAITIAVVVLILVLAGVGLLVPRLRRRPVIYLRSDPERPSLSRP